MRVCVGYVILCFSALRVPRAETRLTVYRSFAIRDVSSASWDRGRRATTGVGGHRRLIFDDTRWEIKDDTFHLRGASLFKAAASMSECSKTVEKWKKKQSASISTRSKFRVNFEKNRNKKRYTATSSLGTSATHSGTATTRSDTVTIHFDSYNLTQADDDGDMREGQEWVLLNALYDSQSRNRPLLEE